MTFHPDMTLLSLGADPTTPALIILAAMAIAAVLASLLTR